MKLIVGLGNPGKQYENTRHNIGFMVIDNYANNHGISIQQEKFNGLYAKVEINQTQLILLKPLSYMNLSGEVVRKYVDYFKINIEDVLIINDDLDLIIGTYKLRYKGSSGGHNGLKNIELNLNTQNYKRIKIGISNNKTVDTKNYVLGRLSESEQKTFNKFLIESENILDDYLTMDFNNLMNKYNK